MLLQLLHASDLEGGVDAIENAPNFAAVAAALEADAADSGYTSITVSAGDNYLSGPFFSAASDPSLRPALQAAYQALFGEPGLTGIAEGSGRVDIAIMNIIGFDASAIGNHEFDLGSDTFETIIEEAVLGATLADIQHLGAQFPYLSSNLDFSTDLDLGNLFTADILPNTDFALNPADALAGVDPFKIAQATTIEADGELIGVVGTTTQLLETISSPSGTVEITGGQNDMAALAAVLQPVIDDLIDGADNLAGSGDDVDKVVLVSHLQDINLEQELAGLLSGVDIIVAGGSDTLLADATDPLRTGDVAAGDYPIETVNADGDPALIVSTDGEYTYVGRLVVEFDDNGVLTNFGGGAGLVDAAVSGAYATDEAGVLAVTGEATLDDALANSPTASLVHDLVQAVSDVVSAADGNIAGETEVFIEGRREFVRTEETNMGNLTADANLAEARKFDEMVAVSIKNGGGIRAPIGEVDGITGELLPTGANPDAGKEAGDVSQLDIQNALRFNNGLSLVTLGPEELLAVLEHGVAASGPGSTPGQFPQVGGIEFSFDVTQPAGARVVDATLVVGGDALVPVVEDGEVLDTAPEAIRVVTLNFLADGGDGYDFDAAGDGSARVDLFADPAALAALGDGAATFAGAGTEQDALAEYLAAGFPNDGAASPGFNHPETPADEDTRIQQLAAGAPVPTGELGEISQVLRFDSGAGEAGTEVVAYEDGRLYSTNGALGRIDIWDLATGQSAGSIDLSGLRGFAGVQSVAVSNGIVAAAISTPDVETTVFGETVTTGRKGYVALFDAETGALIDRVRVGNLPDMLTFTADGGHILVANEGEFNSEAGLDRDPIGSISIITLGDLVDPMVETVDFSAFDGLEDLARAEGIRLAPGRSMLRGLEPEYIAVSPDGTQAFVTLQEANTVAVLDLGARTVVDLLPLGTVDHGAPGNEFDPNDDGVIDIAAFDVHGLRMPDAIASFATGGATYFVTANEGDGRGDAGDLPDGDEARVGDIAAGEVAGVALDASVDTTGLERLTVSTIDGDTDGDGDIDVLHSFGGRGFTIFDEGGEVVFESGSQFERIIADIAPERFNDDEGRPDENRSDAKGPEPEAVTVGEIDGNLYAFIGLERDSGVMIYNVTDPANAAFVDYISGFDFGNVSPETIAFIPGSESASGNPQIAVAHEISGTIAVYEFNASGADRDSSAAELQLEGPGGVMANFGSDCFLL
jgi:2',3'-cyclic-nucleotide 2'-phosphodiesterase (5'-nucleotidase family)